MSINRTKPSKISKLETIALSIEPILISEGEAWYPTIRLVALDVSQANNTCHKIVTKVTKTNPIDIKETTIDIITISNILKVDTDGAMSSEITTSIIDTKEPIARIQG